MDEPLNFDYIDELRRTMLLSTRDMAILLGVSRQTYYDWRKQRKVLSKKHHVHTLEVVKMLFEVLNSGWPTPEVRAAQPQLRLEHFRVYKEKLGIK